MNVFLLEDNRIFQYLIKGDLLEEGHDVFIWDSVEGAVERIMERDFDLLIIDISLPLEEGCRRKECSDGGVIVLEELAKKNIRLPTIFISALKFPRNRKRIEDLGLMTFGHDVCIYFEKPYDKDLFIKTIRRIEETVTGSRTRWICAEIEGHDHGEPLRMNQNYSLVFSLNSKPDKRPLCWPVRITYDQSGTEKQYEELSIHLSSDDFFIQSEDKYSFKIRPINDGKRSINAFFLMKGSYIFFVKLCLQAKFLEEGDVDVISVEDIGRPISAAYSSAHRDITLIFDKIGEGFKVILKESVVKEAVLPITLLELEWMINDARQEIGKIINLQSSPKGEQPYKIQTAIPEHVHEVAMQQLAQAGIKLFRNIFHARGAGAQVKIIGNCLREMAQKERLRIQIISRHFTLPWNILYLADTYDPGRIDPEMFLGFRHIIESIPIQQDMRIFSKNIDGSEKLSVSLNLNTDIDTQMGSSFVADQIQYWRNLEGVSGTRVTIKNTKDQVIELLEDSSSPNQIIYFYCHASSNSLSDREGPGGSYLKMTGGERLTLDDLNLSTSDETKLAAAPLIFINACESTRLSPLFYDGFVPYFMAKGARGVIGSEGDVPALFAAKWAERFFNGFISGEPLGELLLNLRRKFLFDSHNILGVLYSLYCDGDTRIVGLESML